MPGVEIEVSTDEMASSRVEAAHSEDLNAKGEVNYRVAADITKACASCSHIIAEVGELDGRCELVAGRIRGTGICDLFERRKAGSPPIRPEDARKAARDREEPSSTME
ncbi:MAG: hypothetical protein GY795_33170 [Desulfobacterales bacterium]|nr:hypothetical protein [Desulfobacterales bacterium]